MASAAIAAWLAAALVPAAQALPPDYLAIALKVAGSGLPDCRSYLPDGSEAPCLPRFVVKPGNRINGWSRNGEIVFTEGDLRRLPPDQFALLAGHEIAHWYLGHAGSSAVAELEADQLGAELACRAGYDVAAGTALFGLLPPDQVHPRPAQRRRAALQAACVARR